MSTSVDKLANAPASGRDASLLRHLHLPQRLSVIWQPCLRSAYLLFHATYCADGICGNRRFVIAISGDDHVENLYPWVWSYIDTWKETVSLTMATIKAIEASSVCDAEPLGPRIQLITRRIGPPNTIGPGDRRPLFSRKGACREWPRRWRNEYRYDTRPSHLTDYMGRERLTGNRKRGQV